MFAPFFRRPAALTKRAFQGVCSEELQQLEAVLKKIGKRADSLAKQKVILWMDKCGGMPILRIVGRLRRWDSFKCFACCAEVAIPPRANLVGTAGRRRDSQNGSNL